MLYLKVCEDIELIIYQPSKEIYYFDFYCSIMSLCKNQIKLYFQIWVKSKFVSEKLILNSIQN